MIWDIKVATLQEKYIINPHYTCVTPQPRFRLDVIPGQPNCMYPIEHSRKLLKTLPVFSNLI